MACIHIFDKEINLICGQVSFCSITSVNVGWDSVRPKLTLFFLVHGFPYYSCSLLLQSLGKVVLDAPTKSTIDKIT